jgi:uncharacterized protein with HEPN domain
MSKTEAALVADMLKYARKAHSKVVGVSREAFDADDNLQLALAYLILIIGEAASRLSRASHARLPELPWSDIIGMRHRLVHGYGAVSANIVWDVATTDLEPLIAALETFTPPEPL